MVSGPVNLIFDTQVLFFVFVFVTRGGCLCTAVGSALESVGSGRRRRALNNRDGIAFKC